MSDMTEAKASCLCGAVRITAKNASPGVGACHCSMCRKWGGGPLMVVACGADVSFAGEEHITVFDSSEWGGRGFCGKCGSHLFYKLKQSGEYMVPAGLFDGDEAFVFERQIFVDERPAFYRFADETAEMTGEEVFAASAPPSE